ncbi:putative Glra4a protein [Schistosoma japonicum]|uniref:Putative Glra4a protein n=1 Tax=Schistosoma japonicum TaxID=6182 RepID=A0A4Z2DHA3_SCHJA|nr:putative Glra4a protein [Schistosoma japonicum]
MSGNYTSSSNQWIRNKTLIVPENHNSSTLPYNLRENVNYEPISNYNTLINSKSLDSSQNRHRSPVLYETITIINTKTGYIDY